MKQLSLKQKKFIEFYDGNATEAAKKAGYSPKTAYSIGQENLKKPEILKEIQTRQEKERKEKIADRQKRQEFWTNIMSDPKMDMACRLKASELLGKSEADFMGKIQVSNDTQSLVPRVSKATLEDRIALIRKMRGLPEPQESSKELKKE